MREKEYSVSAVNLGEEAVLLVQCTPVGEVFSAIRDLVYHLKTMGMPEIVMTGLQEAQTDTSHHHLSRAEF